MFNIRDQLLYIAIGVTIIGIVFLSILGGVANETFSKWGGLAIQTAWLFGIVVKQSRDLWHRSFFWSILGILLLAHIVCFASLLHSIEHRKMIWFLPSYPIELLAIATVIEAAVQFGKKQRRGIKRSHGMQGD